MRFLRFSLYNQFCRPSHLIQYTVLEIRFWSVKCPTVTACKTFEHYIPSSIPYGPTHVKTNHFKMLLNVSYIYLFRLYSISIILLLKYNLTNNCSKISKTEMILWMVFILAIWKALESTKVGKKVNVLRIADRNHWRSLFALDHFRNFKGIQLIVEYGIENEE